MTIMSSGAVKAQGPGRSTVPLPLSFSKQALSARALAPIAATRTATRPGFI